MPAALPESTRAQNLANPSVGRVIFYDLLSGPKGSPLDVRKINLATATPTYTNDAANQTPSTGGLNNGIGFGSNYIIYRPASFDPIPVVIRRAGFIDDGIPGVTKPDGTAITNSTLMYIGGGKSGPYSAAVKGVPFPTVPYTAGFGIGGAGSGGSRDAGAGPAFTGFGTKMVTATGSTANGADIEVGFKNRSGITMTNGQSAFGSSAVATAAPV